MPTQGPAITMKQDKEEFFCSSYESRTVFYTMDESSIALSGSPLVLAARPIYTHVNTDTPHIKYRQKNEIKRKICKFYHKRRRKIMKKTELKKNCKYPAAMQHAHIHKHTHTYIYSVKERKLCRR